MNPVPSNLKYMSLIVAGAMHIMDVDGQDIRDILKEQHKDYLLRSMDALDTALLWTAVRIDELLEKEYQDADPD